jgi:homoserine/homoserine lactone efflux protein
MPLEVYLSYVIAVAIVMAIPGPNVTLMIANSLAHGFRYGYTSLLGALSAMAIQLFITVLGMTALMTFLAEWFEVVRWLGVAYLLYLGGRCFMSESHNSDDVKPQPKKLSYIYWQGFLISATNPKTLLFFGAFLPQFVVAEANVMEQLILLSVTTLVIAFISDSCICLMSAKLRPFIMSKGALLNKITGGFFITAAAGLAMARKA